jgi:hypothetical protein
MERLFRDWVSRSARLESKVGTRLHRLACLLPMAVFLGPPHDERGNHGAHTAGSNRKVPSGGNLSCDSAGCSGMVNATEKYTSVSSDGKDTDRMTLLAK